MLARLAINGAVLGRAGEFLDGKACDPDIPGGAPKCAWSFAHFHSVTLGIVGKVGPVAGIIQVPFARTNRLKAWGSLKRRVIKEQIFRVSADRVILITLSWVRTGDAASVCATHIWPDCENPERVCAPLRIAPGSPRKESPSLGRIG